MTIRWDFAHFDDLTPLQVHDLYRLRAEVFVVEQNCVFQDIDGVDPECRHLLGYSDRELLAYCRLLPAGVKFAEPSIGRVITAPSVRRTGMGRVLMAEAMKRARELWPGEPLRIGAQAHLERFYNEFGFTKSSEPYDEDGILHIEMAHKGKQ
ncbi:MAG: GNAT family N-acetyltransferase [Burkholderiales bacterium]|nr:GNAT family N-acetyltransferase [Burkholderiales bacterium]